MKKLVVTLFFGSFLFSKDLRPQSYLLIIQGETGKFYLDHTVSAKENWYSIGREYNISPREIAPFNNLTLNQSLSIGQHLKIPLTKSNFDQTGKKNSGEALVPLYHIVQEKEWMYHISVTYNKVPMATVEKWNHVTGDQVKPGLQLIVGYLKVNSSQSSLANASMEHPVPTPSLTTSSAAIKPAPDDPTLKTTAVPVPPESKTVENLSSNPTPSNSSPPSRAASPHANGGYFAADFTKGSKMISGQAGTFKSTSGWQDGKYYALMNNISVGTIVKITSTATAKSVYAKVLGQLPEMKESDGLSIRISNAAAAELGLNEGKFPVDIQY